MAGKRSAGILLFRRGGQGLEVLLVHPGGPYWARKDLGAWSIPKGEHEPGEDAFDVARRELREETGIEVTGRFVPLGSIGQPGRKVVRVWAVEGDWDPERLRSNTFEMEWPPRSGRLQAFPEVDRAAWFSLPVAREKLSKGQVGFVDRIAEALGLGARAEGDEESS